MSNEKTTAQRLAELQAETVSLLTQQQVRIGSAWEVLYRLGHTMTQAEYQERSNKLQTAEIAARQAREHTDAGFRLLAHCFEHSPAAQVQH